MSASHVLFLTICSSSLLCSATLSQVPSETSLVIYNSGIGLVHESKHLSVDKGKQSIVYPGVATTVQTDSVNVSLPDGVVLYSQQYRFDKITLSKIIQAHIGKTVRYRSGPEAHRTIKDGILLASDPAVIKTQEGIVSGIAPGDFIFHSIPDTLIMKPSLIWNIEAPAKTDGTMELDYLLSQISWKSDYILNLHAKSGDLSGWITVDNRSGKRFEEVKLNLLAGDINRAAAPARYADRILMEKSAAAPAVTRQAVEGYHLYSVPFRVTIADNEKTQIKFIDRPNHALKRLYDVTMQTPYTVEAERKLPVSQSVELSEFAVPLPGGIVRTYSKSGDTTVLLGETHLDNTPKNEKVKLRLGTNFDLVAKNRLVARSDDSRYYSATVGYTLSNRSDTLKTVDVNIPGVIEQTQHQTSVKTTESYTRPDGFTLRFSFTLKAGETKTWEVSYRTRKE